MSKIIPLTQGKETIVDDEYYEYLSQARCFLTGKSDGGYAGFRIDNNIILVHRFIMNTPPGMETDHINGDSLDNRRSNLRVCTHLENGYNRGKQSNNTSGYKGVYWHSQRNKWAAQIDAHGKHVYIGIFEDILEAAQAYDEKAIELHGKFANVNFR